MGCLPLVRPPRSLHPRRRSRPKLTLWRGYPHRGTYQFHFEHQECSIRRHLEAMTDRQGHARIWLEGEAIVATDHGAE